VRWLKRAADEHGLVLKKPEPSVSFTDIGSNALGFQLSFSIDIKMLGERGKIESDLRFMIDEYFRTAGLAFATPRRDLQFDATRPLEIRVVPQPATDAAPDDVERKAA
jgi:small-conductance mechanosensitive channel